MIFCESILLHGRLQMTLSERPISLGIVTFIKELLGTGLLFKIVKLMSHFSNVLLEVELRINWLEDI